MNNKAAFHVLIPKRASCCVHGKEPFLPGHVYYSVLIDGLDEGSYVRQDYCLTCWKPIFENHAFQQARSIWKGVVPTKKDSSEFPKQRDARALLLLKEVLNKEDPKAYPEAFVLSLYLARRKRLSLRQELKLANGHPAQLYEVNETEEMLFVPKVDLSDLQVEQLQIELAKKFLM